MQRGTSSWLAIAAMCSLAQAQDLDDTLSLTVRGIAPNGIVWIAAPRPIPAGAEIEFAAWEHRFGGQYVPSHRHNGWLTTVLPAELVARSQTTSLDLSITIKAGTPRTLEPRSRVDIRTPAYTLTERTDRQAGFPSRICFASGRVLGSVTWGDRLFDRNAAEPNNASAGV